MEGQGGREEEGQRERIIMLQNTSITRPKTMSNYFQ